MIETLDKPPGVAAEPAPLTVAAEPAPLALAAEPALLVKSDNPFESLAAHLRRAGPGERAVLARLTLGALRPHEIAALSRALLSTGMQPETWRAEAWPRWALLVRGMALAGHDGSNRLGRQFAQAAVAESRVTKLLVSRGDAFPPLLLQILRLLARKRVRPNWFELGELVLKESSRSPDEFERTEQIRLHIAGAYFFANSLAAQK